MAGVGFELRKAISSDNKIKNIKGYIGAAFSSSGSMIVGIVLFSLIQIAAKIQNVDKTISDQFMCYVTNVMFLSMIISSSLSLVLSRYVSNSIYTKTAEKILPSFIGGSISLMSIGGCVLFIQVFISKIDISTAVPLFLLLFSLSVCWLLMTYVTLIRDYMKIVLAYAISFIVALITLFIVSLVTKLDVPKMATILFIGFSVVDIILFRTLYLTFSKQDASLFAFRYEIKKNPYLVFVGILMMVGMLGHFWLTWFLDDSSTTVSLLFRFNSKYDFPAISAYFSTIPAAIYFITLFETRFSEKYQLYFSTLGEGGTVSEVEKARNDLITVIKDGLKKLCIIQLITCLIFITVGAKFLGVINIGMNADMLSSFRVFCVGYSLYYIGNILILIQMYFANERKALISAAVFSISVVGGTIATIHFIPVAKGLAFTISSGIMTLLVGAQLIRYLSKMEQNVLCKSGLSEDYCISPSKDTKSSKKRKPILSSLTVLAALLVIVTSGFMISDTIHRSKIVFFTPKASTDVLLSPGMGLAPWADSDETLEIKTSLVYVELKWSDWEPEDDFFNIEFVKDYYNLDYYREDGRQVVFRFICDEPAEEDHIDIPQWLYEAIEGDGDHYSIEYGKGFSPNYRNELLISEHAEAIDALGEFFGKDDFFVYVELGSIGHWGEWHVDHESGITMIPEFSTREKYISPYLKAFPNAKFLLRYPLIDAKQHSMGLYNDLTGDYDETLYWINQMTESTWEQTGLVEQADCSDNWKTMPVGGEFAQTHENVFFMQSEFDMTLEAIKMSHQSFIGPKIIIDEEEDNRFSRQMDELLRMIGYRYRVSEVKVDFADKDSFDITCSIVNDGIAPIYSSCNIQLEIRDNEGGVVWSSSEVDFDLRNVLPNDPCDFTISVPKEEFDDDSLYTLTISIVDKSGLSIVPMALEDEIEKNTYAIAEFSIK